MAEPGQRYFFYESVQRSSYYAGPYSGRLDPRNYWTARQDTLPASAPVALSPTSRAHSSSAGGGSFAVAMTGPGNSQSWSVQNSASAWLHLTSPPANTPQFTDGSVTYTVDANATGSARTGVFVVNGQTFTVDQDKPAFVPGTDFTLDAAMQGYWYMEEASGNRLDGSGKGNHLTSVNSVGQSSTKKQGSFSASFSRAASRHLTRADASLSAGFPGKNGSAAQDVTAGCWIYPASVTPTRIWAIGKDNGFWIIMDTDSLIKCQVFSGGTYPNAVSDAAWPLNTWHHVVIRFLGTTTRKITLFVNGVPQAFGATASTGVMASTRGFFIGANSFSGDYFDGLIDEAFVMSRGLSDAEVLGIFNKRLNGLG